MLTREPSIINATTIVKTIANIQGNETPLMKAAYFYNLAAFDNLLVGHADETMHNAVKLMLKLQFMQTSSDILTMMGYFAPAPAVPHVAAAPPLNDQEEMKE